MLLTVDQLREHLTTALEDDALKRLLDAAEEAINAVAGAPGEVTELIDGGGTRLVLASPASELVTVTEIASDDTETELDLDTDYIFRSPYYLEREAALWKSRVRVVYTAVPEWATRMQVQIKLVELALNSPAGVGQNTIGPFNEQFNANSVFNYEIERQMILAPLRRSTGMTVI